jgi:hypothetical protein
MKIYKKMKNIISIILFIITFPTNAQHENHKMSSDKPSTHGMLLFGREKIYASHLPMFHSPHDYQIILELELSKSDKKKYVSDKNKNSNYTTYTIEPEKFVLPDMINNPKPFKVNLYRGHFERGGIEILKNITVKIVQIVSFKKFNPEETKAKTTNFILFGNEKEQFLAHEITSKPDFDQIIEAKTNLNSFLQKEKFAIVSLNNSENYPIGISSNEVLINEKPIVLLKQLYIEFDDLKN